MHPMFENGIHQMWTTSLSPTQIGEASSFIFEKMKASTWKNTSLYLHFKDNLKMGCSNPKYAQTNEILANF